MTADAPIDRATLLAALDGIVEQGLRNQANLIIC